MPNTPNCTEIPHEYRSSKSDGGKDQPEVWTAQRAWFVEGATDDEQARTAPPIFGSDPIPQLRTGHPLNTDLICTELPVETLEGGRVRIVRAIYTMLNSAQGTFSGIGGPTTYSIDWGGSSEPFDIDPQLNIAVTNTAGDPPLQNLFKEYHDMAFVVERDELFFPVQKALYFKDTVNDQRYTIPGLGYYVEAGQALCVPIQLVAPIIAGQKAVRVRYMLKLRKDGWKTRMRNEGYQAFRGVSDSEFADDADNDQDSLPRKSNIVTKDGDPITMPALLDKDGVPIEKTFQVRADDGDLPPIPNPTPITKELSAEDAKSLIETTKSGAVFLHYNKYDKVSFQGLL